MARPGYRSFFRSYGLGSFVIRPHATPFGPYRDGCQRQNNKAELIFWANEKR